MEHDKLLIDHLVDDLLNNYLSHCILNFSEFSKFELNDILQQKNNSTQSSVSNEKEAAMMNLFKLIIIDTAINTLSKFDGVSLTDTTNSKIKLFCNGLEIQAELRGLFINLAKKITNLDDLELRFISS